MYQDLDLKLIMYTYNVQLVAFVYMFRDNTI